MISSESSAVTAIPSYLKKSAVYVKSLANKTVKKAYRKLKVKSGSYIAFDYGFTDTADESELPINVRITVPEGYDIDHTFLYYCPNRKTIVGRMNRKVINARTFECTLFNTGTYMLVYSPQLTENE